MAWYEARYASVSPSSCTMVGGQRPHSTMEMRPRGSRCCSSADKALIPCFQEIFTARNHSKVRGGGSHPR